jgi:hypothetical protein
MIQIVAREDQIYVELLHWLNVAISYNCHVTRFAGASTKWFLGRELTKPESVERYFMSASYQRPCSYQGSPKLPGYQASNVRKHEGSPHSSQAGLLTVPATTVPTRSDGCS